MKTKTPKGQHTPGPWRISEYQVAGIGERVTLQILAANELVGIASRSMGRHIGKERSLDEARANAHLIAAAPELLAASRLALADMEDALRFIPGNFDNTTAIRHSMQNRIEELRAAIARAEGGSHV